MKVEVVEIDRDVEELLNSSLEAKVVNIFDRSINLIVEGELISLACSSLPLTPMMTKLDDDHFRLIRDSIGDKCLLSDFKFDLKNSSKISLYISKNTTLSRDALIFLENKINEYLILSGKESPIRDAYLSIENDSIFSRTYREIFSKKNYREFAKLIGLGSGLTPSGDDFIYGFISALLFLSNFIEERDFFKSIEICDKTTTVSYYMLKNLLYNSKVSKTMIDFFKNFSNLDEVINIGSTSGTDILTGVSYGIRYILDKG